jgi:hypothetical protein
MDLTVRLHRRIGVRSTSVTWTSGEPHRSPSQLETSHSFSPSAKMAAATCSTKTASEALVAHLASYAFAQQTAAIISAECLDRRPGFPASNHRHAAAAGQGCRDAEIDADWRGDHAL